MRTAAFTTFELKVNAAGSWANVTVLKIMSGPTGWLEVAAYLLGGPLGILTSMAIHPWMVRRLGRRHG